MFVLWRVITITGIAAAVITKGHKDVKSQFGFIAISTIKVPGKNKEAIIDAKEIYRQTKTRATHIVMVTKAQIV